jgi:hypothetical protein
MIKVSQLLFNCVVVALLLGAGECLRTSTSPLMQISVINPPSFLCSAYCSYEINSNYNLVSMCGQTYTSGNGYCNKCDPLLFREVSPGLGAGTVFCIPHLYNSENGIYAGTLDYQFGYYSDTSGSSWINTNLYPATGLSPHYAIRIRFGVYLYHFDHPDYIYPLEYSIDGNSAIYNQTLDKYWSPYDIITS